MNEKKGIKKGKVISFAAVKKFKTTQDEEYAYKAKILTMDKLDLLNEMVNFQEERAKVGHLTPEMMVRGKILFEQLEIAAETDALRALTRSYRRHLSYEMEDYLKTGEIRRD